MFADVTTMKLGEVTVKVRRLTLREIREARSLVLSGEPTIDESYDRIIRDHITLEDGSPVNPEDLTISQVRQLMTELVGIPEGSGISNFIGLLL